MIWWDILNNIFMIKHYIAYGLGKVKTFQDIDS